MNWKIRLTLCNKCCSVFDLSEPKQWKLCHLPLTSHPTAPPGFGAVERRRGAMSEVPAPQLLCQSHSRMPTEDGGRSPAVPARGVPEHYTAGEERGLVHFFYAHALVFRRTFWNKLNAVHWETWIELFVTSCCVVQTWPTCTPSCGPCQVGCLTWSRSCRSISTMRASEAPVTSLRKM